MRRSKTPRQRQSDKADKLARELCHRRGRCEAAGLDEIKCNGVLQWAHIIGRANRRLRWEPLNCLLLCAGHHVWYTHHEWDWKDFIETHFPENYAFVQAHRNERWDRDLAAVIDRLSMLAEGVKG